jgi:predicted HTH domain antitoxin
MQTAAKLEQIAIEGYRSGALTHHQATQLLGLSRFEFDDFLTDRGIDDHAYSIMDLQQARRPVPQCEIIPLCTLPVPRTSSS